MQQIKYRAVGQCLRLEEAWRPVAGTVGRYQAVFSLDESWDDLTCTAVFRGPKATVEQLLTDGICVVPWEALQVRGWLEVGLYGVCGSERLPTLWAEPIVISDGPAPADTAQDPTPDKWQQYVEELKGDIPNAVEEYMTENPAPEGPPGPAGHTPEKGTDYWTEADKRAMVQDVLAALPVWNGGSY